jgi:hypothetical protein
MKNAPAIPEQINFPVSLDLFLRYTAGGKYKADRLRKYRACLADNEQFHRFMLEGRQQGKELSEIPKPSLIEISETVARHRVEKFSEFQFWICASVFKGWLTAQPSIRAKHAAKTRWSKTNCKNRNLTQTETGETAV